jgi:adenylosuccinate synthase
VVARYAAMINGVDFWALTKLDVLDELDSIRIGVAYECRGRRLESVPAGAPDLEACRPVYEEMPGWKSSTRDVARYDQLPDPARAYLDRLVKLTGVPIGILSLGPRPIKLDLAGRVS